MVDIQSVLLIKRSVAAKTLAPLGAKTELHHQTSTASSSAAEYHHPDEASSSQSYEKPEAWPGHSRAATTTFLFGVGGSMLDAALFLAWD